MWAIEENNARMGNIPQGGMGYFGAKPVGTINKKVKKDKKMAMMNSPSPPPWESMSDVMARFHHEQREQYDRLVAGLANQAAQQQQWNISQALTGWDVANANPVPISDCLTVAKGEPVFIEMPQTKKSSNKLLLLIKKE